MVVDHSLCLAYNCYNYFRILFSRGNSTHTTLYTGKGFQVFPELKYSSFHHRHSIAFVYGKLLRDALDDFKMRWNSHRIRPSRTSGCPPGVPNDIYLLPSLTGTCILKVEILFWNMLNKILLQVQKVTRKVQTLMFGCTAM